VLDGGAGDARARRRGVEVEPHVAEPYEIGAELGVPASHAPARSSARLSSLDAQPLVGQSQLLHRDVDASGGERPRCMRDDPYALQRPGVERSTARLVEPGHGDGPARAVVVIANRSYECCWAEALITPCLRVISVAFGQPADLLDRELRAVDEAGVRSRQDGRSEIHRVLERRIRFPSGDVTRDHSMAGD
jgi:hypothetical protein